MSDFSGYSLSGCLIDDSYSGPRLTSEMGSDPARANGDVLPPVVDLRKWCSPVEDQRKTGTCVANAVVGALELLQRKEGHSVQDLSRLFVYYNARSMHDFDTESGTGVPFAMAAIIAHGICEERLWPFSELSVDEKPTQACYDNAQNYRGVEFAELEKGTPLTHVLARGIPVVIGVSLPREAYLSAMETGLMQVPAGWQPNPADGAHAMLVVGYDLEKRVYIVRNSWGERYAAGGYFLMPFNLFDTSSLVCQTWAIGSLGTAPGLKLLGASVPQAVEQMAGAAVTASKPGGKDPGAGLRGELQGNIDRARSTFAKRLRDR